MWNCDVALFNILEYIRNSFYWRNCNGTKDQITKSFGNLMENEDPEKDALILEGAWQMGHTLIPTIKSDEKNFKNWNLNEI